MFKHVNTHRHTQCCQAKEEGWLLRTIKQKVVFRTVHLSRETKRGSTMTLQWGNLRVTGGVMDTPKEVSYTCMLQFHAHISQTYKFFCARLRIIISSSLLILEPWGCCVTSFLHSTKTPLCFIKGCF